VKKTVGRKKKKKRRAGDTVLLGELLVARGADTNALTGDHPKTFTVKKTCAGRA